MVDAGRIGTQLAGNVKSSAAAPDGKRRVGHFAVVTAVTLLEIANLAICLLSYAAVRIILHCCYGKKDAAPTGIENALRSFLHWITWAPRSLFPAICALVCGAKHGGKVVHLDNDAGTAALLKGPDVAKLIEHAAAAADSAMEDLRNAEKDPDVGGAIDGNKRPTAVVKTIHYDAVKIPTDSLEALTGGKYSCKMHSTSGVTVIAIVAAGTDPSQDSEGVNAEWYDRVSMKVGSATFEAASSHRNIVIVGVGPRGAYAAQAIAQKTGVASISFGYGLAPHNPSSNSGQHLVIAEKAPGVLDGPDLPLGTTIVAPSGKSSGPSATGGGACAALAKAVTGE
ncbi:MAG: hypothetical protein LBI39_02945 [Puniceicoccales bacterium]|nr:hypothetical protein [Puniceicoccales bacterium]